ncbi:hypothetical protein EV06_0732 [Prochlorococcus sp. MIT 0602]|nr:hypothetical protein EV06_0732 [Prochlorococcus sp. MIT 0602]
MSLIDNNYDLSMQYQFELETLKRSIADFNDIDLLKEISMQLLELCKKKIIISKIASKQI